MVYSHPVESHIQDGGTRDRILIMVLTATGTTGRLGKASKNGPGMEKDGNLIKNTKKLWKKWQNSGCACLSQYFLWKTTMI